MFVVLEVSRNVAVLLVSSFRLPDEQVCCCSPSEQILTLLLWDEMRYISVQRIESALLVSRYVTTVLIIAMLRYLR